VAVAGPLAYVAEGETGMKILDITAVNLGDVNGSTSITSYDASLILQYVVGLITFEDPASQCKADVDQNGGGTSFDASLVLQCVVGLCGNLSPYPGFLSSCTSHGHCP